jgi:pyruvate formate lyase activating enzyme
MRDNLEVRRSRNQGQGLIAAIQQFSLHDGPGIRTTIFFKGCNLDCRWCHNPETIDFDPQILLKPEKCIRCGQCAQGCFSDARTWCGELRSIASVLDEILLDAPYYGETGGVTLSGGEPACQWRFARDLLKACQAHGLHTVVESNMALPYRQIGAILKHNNLLLADLKVWDEEVHQAFTGAGNRLIKTNIRRASADGMPIILHTPVVPGVNDTLANIEAIACFAASLPTLVCYELLPYNPLGLAKGAIEGHKQEKFDQPSAQLMSELAQAAKKFGIPVRIAGKPVE